MPGDEDRAAGELGAGDAHDEAEVRDESVVGAQHGGAQRVAAEADAPPLGARERLGGPARGRARAQVLSRRACARSSSRSSSGASGWIV